MTNIRDFHQKILTTANTLVDRTKLEVEKPGEHIKDQIGKILNHLDRLIRFDGNNDELNTEIKGLYRAIFDYRAASIQGTFLDRGFAEIGRLARLDDESWNNSAFESFDMAMYELLGTGMHEGYNEDIKHISSLAATVFSPDSHLTMKIEGNTDSDLNLVIAEVLGDFDDELLSRDLGFEITLGIDDRNQLGMLSCKGGHVMPKKDENSNDLDLLQSLFSVPNEVYIVPKEESDLNEDKEWFDSRRNEAEFAADRFFERLQQAIASNGNIDPNDFDNVTIRIIK